MAALLTLHYPRGFGARQILYSLGSLSFRPTCHRDDTVLFEVGIGHAVDILMSGVVVSDSSSSTYP